MMIINQLIQIGEALNIDLRDFYKQLYTIILSLSLNPNIDSKKRRAEMVENDNDESNDDDNNDDNDDDDSDDDDDDDDDDELGKIKISNEISITSEQELLMKGLEFMFFKYR